MLFGRQALGMGSVSALLFLMGCSVPPSLTGVVGPSDITPTVDDVIKNIQCEIRDVQKEPLNPADPESGLVDKFQKSHYVAYINLTIDVTHNQGLTPGFSFLNNMGTLTGMVNFQLTGTQHRNINPTFTLDLSRDYAAAVDRVCQTYRESPFGIKGDLGLREVILTAVSKSTSDDFGYKLIQATTDLPKVVATPVFVSTIDFTVTTGVNGGPNWTFKHFKGPGGGSNGLANANRVEKDTLVISFAPIPVSVAAPPVAAPGQRELLERLPTPPAAPPAAAADQAAAAAAQNAATTSILQNLLNRLPPITSP